MMSISKNENRRWWNLWIFSSWTVKLKSEPCRFGTPINPVAASEVGTGPWTWSRPHLLRVVSFLHLSSPLHVNLWYKYLPCIDHTILFYECINAVTVNYSWSAPRFVLSSDSMMTLRSDLNSINTPWTPQCNDFLPTSSMTNASRVP